MEPRTEWTDARLNDLVERLDRTLERLEQGQRELRVELRGEVSSLRSELQTEVSALRRDGMVATVAIIAAIVGTGALN
jgi:hypothetical protein